MQIREAEKQDVSNILPMIESLAKFHGDTPQISAQELIRDAFQDPPWIYIVVAEQYGNLVGYAALCPLVQLQMGARGIDMHHLFVKEACRGLGIGQKLTQAAMKKAKDLSCKYMMVGTQSENLKAQSFYRAFGFEERTATDPRFRILL